MGIGGKGVPVTYPIMYKELDEMKVRVRLQGNLTWHARRIGRASRGNQLGVRKTSFKAAGLVLSQALADSWE